MDEDDDIEYFEHLPSTQLQTGQCVQTPVPPEEAQSSRKKKKSNREAGTNVLTEDDLQELAAAVVKIVQDNLDGLKT